MFKHIKLDVEVPELQQLNENGSRQYLTPGGKKYPSVTTVLSEYSKKGILNWRKRVGEEVANAVVRKASVRGTALHKECEKYLNNEKVTIVMPDRLELFKSLIPLLNRIDNIYVQEQRMYSDYLRMAGTVDCVAEFDGKLTVIDFKSSSRIKLKEDIENYFMQCSAYAVMFEERYKIPVNRTAVLIAVEGDQPQIFIEKRDNYVENLMYFRDLYERKYGDTSRITCTLS